MSDGQSSSKHSNQHRCARISVLREGLPHVGKEGSRTTSRIALLLQSTRMILLLVTFPIILRPDCHKGVCGSNRRKAKQRCGIRTGDSLCVPSVWPESVCGQDEEVDRYSKRDRTGIGS